MLKEIPMGRHFRTSTRRQRSFVRLYNRHKQSSFAIYFRHIRNVINPKAIGEYISKLRFNMRLVQGDY